ncbi:anillin isoform X2 [Betta splendens]|uniref:Anillin n=1 Tax=Betta splendens TaxID=158456 RepID=A0A6P7P0M4_BETSP|nr:anillin isoform X2 [Betta splendens]
MDPFTEKLLERTRARRENLQKKMAERPNAANRQMIKRPREPLADTNCVTIEPPTDQVPHGSTKPSPSKRMYSGENVQPFSDENQNPVVSPPTASTMSNPPTNKKPPAMPTVTQPSSILDNTDTVLVVQFQPSQLKTDQPASGTMNPNLFLSFSGPSTSKAEVAPASPSLHRNKDHAVSNSAPSAAAMKSRLQKLAEQRKFWDGNSDSPSDTTSLTPLKKQTEVPPAATSSTSSEMFLGRRGRLANLAATIGSWEDDLSHANIPRQNTKEKPVSAVSKFTLRDATVSTTSTSLAEGCSVAMSAASSKFVPVFSQSSSVVPQTLQKVDIQKSKSAQQPGANRQKSATDEPAFPLRPQTSVPSPSTSVIESPQKNQVLSNEDTSPASPKKPALCAKPVIGGASDVHEKASSGAPVVKSFLERFGERCHEQTGQGSPAGSTVQAKTRTATPSATPHTRLLQERLRAAQAANTTSADLTQRQKLQRESELAQIRSCVQKVNNLWKNADRPAEGKECSDVKFVKCAEVTTCQPQSEVLSERMDTPTEYHLSVQGPGLSSPPASTSSPLKVVPCTGEKPVADNLEQEVVKDLEMNVDQSANSALINELFNCVLEQEDQEDEDEDAFNISSMSLLTPLVETVAAAVKSPEKGMMTSTPASSFIVKESTPDRTPTPDKFQRSDLTQATSAPSDSAGYMEDEHRLPYSIDAYRSTRVKDTERPIVKQINLLKDNVSNQADEPRTSSVFSIKQKIKILTNEINLQQTVIHQASQALNCCTDEEHGKGSQVEAEAERLLLVATAKREALKTELERLKGDPKEHRREPEALEPCRVSPSRGLVTLHEFRLPLKADFVCSIANKPESTKHSFFLLIRAGAEKTVATPLASTHRGLSGDTLSFQMNYTISDVSSDFEIDIEVYCLEQKREVCSDKKKKPTKSKAITPKRFLTITKNVQTPVVASPGGPNAVRTSNFVLVGTHKLTLASVGRSKFLLEKVPFLCPLEGHIYLKLQCEVASKVEERGFLTMFEDVSGFGAWHRRWCVMSGYCISYWTYPDDEKCKNPIGCISLANCTSKRVEPANREFCARPNTLELITVRPQREGDRETLVSQCKNTMCVTRNWLSADTKDERNLWMKKLNQVLVDLHMWQPATQGPL